MRERRKRRKKIDVRLRERGARIPLGRDEDPEDRAD